MNKLNYFIATLMFSIVLQNNISFAVEEDQENIVPINGVVRVNPLAGINIIHLTDLAAITDNQEEINEIIDTMNLCSDLAKDEQYSAEDRDFYSWCKTRCITQFAKNPHLLNKDFYALITYAKHFQDIMDEIEVLTNLLSNESISLEIANAILARTIELIAEDKYESYSILTASLAKSSHPEVVINSFDILLDNYDYGVVRYELQKLVERIDAGLAVTEEQFNAIEQLYNAMYPAEVDEVVEIRA